MVRSYMPKSCYRILQYLEVANEQQTHKDLVIATGLAPRTVRYAVRRLKEEGFIIEKFNFKDARQTLYSLNYNVAPVAETATV